MTDGNLPAPQASFLSLNSGQWKTIATWLIVGPIGIYYKALALKYGLPVPDADTLGSLLMQYVPILAGLALAVGRRTQAAIVAEAAKILAAKQAPQTAVVVAQAAADIKATATTSAKVASHPLVLLLLGVVALASCTTAPDGTKTIKTPTVATISADVGLVAGGLQNALKAAAAVPDLNIPTDTLNIAQASLAGLQGTAQSIAGASSVAAAQPMVQQVETYVNAFVGAVSAVPGLPDNVRAYLQAANVLLPVIEIAVNMAVPVPAAANADQARSALAMPSQ
jgi:hypothetical protein